MKKMNPNHRGDMNQKVKQANHSHQKGKSKFQILEFYKSIIVLILLFEISLSAFAKFNSEQVFIEGKTNKQPLTYQPGEAMIFTFNINIKKQSSDGLFLKWIRRGDDGKSAEGKVQIFKSLTVKTSLDRPGFVSINVFLIDSKGKILQQKYKTGDNKIKERNIAFYAGAAVLPKKLSDCGEPSDFDEFWAEQKKRIAQVPFKEEIKLKKVATKDGADIYAVLIPCAGPSPVSGYLNVPVRAKAKSLPATILFHGYGVSPQNIPEEGNRSCLILEINAHGQELGREAIYYRNFFNHIRSNGYDYAFDPEQNSNPEQAFFNGMALRVLRGLEYLKSRPEWNGKNLTARGGSQGGLQTMWAVALDTDVTVAKPEIIWCCDLAGTVKKKRLSGSWRLKYVPALDYYDPVFMAKRIKKAKVVITRAGLGDYVSPPSGLAICYKNIASPNKSIYWVQGGDHMFIPPKSDRIKISK